MVCYPVSTLIEMSCAVANERTSLVFVDGRHLTLRSPHGGKKRKLALVARESFADDTPALVTGGPRSWCSDCITLKLPPGEVISEWVHLPLTPLAFNVLDEILLARTRWHGQPTRLFFILTP